MMWLGRGTTREKKRKLDVCDCSYLVVHKLEGKGRFANTTAAHHDDFVDHGLSCFGRFGSHFALLLLLRLGDGGSLDRPPGRWRWGWHRLLVKQQTLKLSPATPERTPGPAAGRWCGGGPVVFAPGRAAAIAGRRRRRWRPSKGKDLGMIGIFGFLPTFLDGLGNWKTDRIRPFGHRLPDRIPVFSHLDAHFFFDFTNSHETTKQQQQTTTHSPNAYGTVSTDWLTKSWPYSLRFSSQKFSTLNKSSSPSSSCFELSYTPEAASESFHILRRDLLIMTFTSRLIDARDYTHIHAYRSWRQFLKQQQRF